MVRLHDVSGTIYFWKDGQWILSPQRVKLPAGWYAGAIDLTDDNNTTTNP